MKRRTIALLFTTLLPFLSSCFIADATGVVGIARPTGQEARERLANGLRIPLNLIYSNRLSGAGGDLNDSFVEVTKTTFLALNQLGISPGARYEEHSISGCEFNMFTSSLVLGQAVLDSYSVAEVANEEIENLVLATLITQDCNIIEASPIL